MAAVYKSLSKKTDQKAEAPADGVVKRANKQRVLLLSSRGVTYRHRHLLNDLATLMPHAKRDVKWDQKSNLSGLNELAELYNCNHICYFEARKGKDLYIYLAKTPNGPCVKFHVQNIHTMEELNFPGNCLKGSRPILSFDSAFETEPHLQLIKEILIQQFGVPQGTRKSKPFVDRVMGFSYLDGKIWLRNFEIKEQESNGQEDGETVTKGGKTISTSLQEIGPRVTLTPVIVQEGSFGGPLIFENRNFVSPNFVRADLRRQKAARHNARAEKVVERLSKKGDLGLRSKDGQPVAKDELDTKALFA
ncbi:ribosome biogenesis protein brx1 [Colletotrichum truncatum]|uniref:Ribosome biogenesis protein brx1 n=1 Tax=Colletotrichum truncatum TaxID=5467 RepID=A0ACC3Z9A6_COLTU|nr:ribosome biogenesis protein brx1 [Colletotrichum truncatum]KAF6793552.1 ribosome biogenesis protein brx1 [Colletotrichum truncatum]